MRDFRMELQAIKFPAGILHRRKIGIFGARGRPKTVGQSGHFITVTVPNIKVGAQAVEQLGTICDMENARPEFAPSAELHLPSEMVRHQHQAVANTKQRDA